MRLDSDVLSVMETLSICYLACLDFDPSLMFQCFQIRLHSLNLFFFISIICFRGANTAVHQLLQRIKIEADPWIEAGNSKLSSLIRE